MCLQENAVSPHLTHTGACVLNRCSVLVFKEQNSENDHCLRDTLEMK